MSGSGRFQIPEQFHSRRSADATNERSSARLEFAAQLNCVFWISKVGVTMSTAGSQVTKSGTNSNSGWNAEAGKETDTAILRYNRVAMLEAVISIRDRKRQFLYWTAATILLLAGVLVIAAGIFGWLS